MRISVLLPTLIASLVCFSFGQDVTFKSTIFPSHGAAAVQGDLNGDEILDIVSPGPRSDFNKNGFYVSLSNSDGTYQTPVFYTSPYPGDGNIVALGDFNGDGKLDVVAVEGTKGYYIFLNNGKGQLLPSWNFATRPGDSNHGVIAADFNHDGQADLVILADDSSTATVQLEMLVGKGNGTFTPSVAFDSNAAGGNLFIGDFDDDGNADLATSLGPCQRDVGCFTRIRVYYGDGKAGFSPPTVIDYDESYAFMVSNDINQDGHSDLIGTSGQGVLSPVVRILLGTSKRTFKQIDVPLVSGLAPGLVPVDVADFNGDGIKDIAVGEFVSGQWSVAVKLGNKDGSYQPEKDVYDSSVPLDSLMSGRNDDDTRPDLLSGYSLDGSNFDTRVLSLNNVTAGGHFPGCAPPKAAKGIAVCSPKNGSVVSSPALLHVGAAFTSPLRKTEVWIDGHKLLQSFNSYSNYSFLDGAVPLSAGPHKADIFTADFGNDLQHSSVTFTVH